MHKGSQLAGDGPEVGGNAAPEGDAGAGSAWSNPIWGDDWEEARRLWLLDPEVAHCNHGSFGALPAQVFEIQNEFRRRMAVNPMRLVRPRDARSWPRGATRGGATSWARPEGRGLRQQRQRRGLGRRQSLPLGAGDEMVSTDHAYGAVSSALDRLSARTGAKRVVAAVPIESSDDEVVGHFTATHCTERTAGSSSSTR